METQLCFLGFCLEVDLQNHTVTLVHVLRNYWAPFQSSCLILHLSAVHEASGSLEFFLVLSDLVVFYCGCAKIEDEVMVSLHLISSPLSKDTGHLSMCLWMSFVLRKLFFKLCFKVV